MHSWAQAFQKVVSGVCIQDKQTHDKRPHSDGEKDVFSDAKKITKSQTLSQKVSKYEKNMT